MYGNDTETERNVKIAGVIIIVCVVLLVIAASNAPKNAGGNCTTNAGCTTGSCINGICVASAENGNCSINSDCVKGLVCSEGTTCVNPNPFCTAKEGLFWFALACIVLGFLGYAGSVTITHSSSGIKVTMGALLFGVLLLIINFLYIKPC